MRYSRLDRLFLRMDTLSHRIDMIEAFLKRSQKKPAEGPEWVVWVMAMIVVIQLVVFVVMFLAPD